MGVQLDVVNDIIPKKVYTVLQINYNPRSLQTLSTTATVAGERCEDTKTKKF